LSVDRIVTWVLLLVGLTLTVLGAALVLNLLICEVTPIARGDLDDVGACQ